MGKALQRISALLNRLQDAVFKSLFRARFRYDIFISYAHRDAGEYAVNLKKQLSRLDFTCFIDEEGSPPGVSLTPTLERALDRSAALVVLGTENALKRPFVSLELEKFARSKRAIIPVNIASALSRGSAEVEEVLGAAPWNVIRERELVWIDETQDAISKAVPSPVVADGIDRLFKYTRRNVRVRAEIIGTAFVVLLAAAGAGLVIKGQAADLAEQGRRTAQANREATEATERAEVAKQEATRLNDIAEQAREKALQQQHSAVVAEAEAKRLGEVARQARVEAARLQEVASRAAAEALKQQEIARSAKLEADRQLERNRHLLYVSDMKLADRAYEEGNVARVPELLNSYLPPAAGPSRPDKPKGGGSDAAGTGDLRGFEWYYLWRAEHEEFVPLTGHRAGYVIVSYSPDGKLLASGGDDGTVHIWDAAKHEEKPPLTGSNVAPTSLSFSPDGKLLAVARDADIELWDAGSFDKLKPVETHDKEWKSVSFGGEGGRTLVTTSKDGPIRLWDVATREAGSSFSVAQDFSYSAALTPDGSTLVAGLKSGRVAFWDTKTKEKPTIKGEGRQINKVALSPDGKLLATADDDGTVKLWDVGSRSELKTLEDSASNREWVAFSRDGKLLATAGSDGTVGLWDVGTRTALERLNGVSDEVNSVEFSPDGKELAVGSDDGGIFLWKPKSLAPAPVRKLPDSLSLSVSTYEHLLATVSKDGTVNLWDTGALQVVESTPDQWQVRGAFKAVLFSPDGKQLATVASDGTVNLWETESLKQRGTSMKSALATFKADSTLPLPAAFSPDGKELAVVDGNVAFWDTHTYKEAAEPPVKCKARCSMVTFSQAGDRLAVTDADSNIDLVDLWRTSSRALLEKQGPNSSNVVSFSPDGKLLSAYGEGNNVKLWDVLAGKEIATLKGHAGYVNRLAFSPDGRTLASASDDGTVRLWDVTTQAEVETLRGNTKGVWFVTFAPDGRLLASDDDDDIVRLWQAATDAEVISQRPTQHE